MWADFQPVARGFAEPHGLRQAIAGQGLFQEKKFVGEEKIDLGPAPVKYVNTACCQFEILENWNKNSAYFRSLNWEIQPITICEIKQPPRPKTEPWARDEKLKNGSSRWKYK